MSTEETPEQTNRVRTSDAEREQVAEALRNAVAEGRLSLEEGDERLAALYQTKFRDELPTLVADLPQGSAWSAGPAAGDGAPGPDFRGGRRGRGWGPPGPGSWGPGNWGGPGGSGPGGPGRGPGAGRPGWGPGGPFGGGDAPDSRVWRRRHLFRAARVAIIVGALIAFTVVTGHFFWPIIPLFFLFQFLRFGAWRHRAMRAGGWGGPGCGHHGYGHGPGYGPGYGSGEGYGPGYGDDAGPWGGRGPGAAA